MHDIHVLLTSDIPGGAEPFQHGDLHVIFHKWTNFDDLPLFNARLWALVDWILPTISGLEVCRRLRFNPPTAQSHITAVLHQDDIAAKRHAINAGADDYILAPINRQRVLDRLLSLPLNDFDDGGQCTLQRGDLVVDIAAFRARWNGRPIPLMPNEFRLLQYLMKHAGRVLTRPQIIAALGKQEPPVDERTVNVWIGRLRRALRDVGADHLLRTVRSLGYVFDEP